MTVHDDDILDFDFVDDETRELPPPTRTGGTRPPGGGPPSGFLTEPGSDQTHNVVAALPPAADYSPLWNVVAYDNADFGLVIDLSSAQAATVLVPSLGLVNCPIVRIQ